MPKCIKNIYLCVKFKREVWVCNLIINRLSRMKLVVYSLTIFDSLVFDSALILFCSIFFVKKLILPVKGNYPKPQKILLSFLKNCCF